MAPLPQGGQGRFHPARRRENLRQQLCGPFGLQRLAGRTAAKSLPPVWNKFNFLLTYVLNIAYHETINVQVGRLAWLKSSIIPARR